MPHWALNCQAVHNFFLLQLTCASQVLRQTDRFCVAGKIQQILSRVSWVLSQLHGIPLGSKMSTQFVSQCPSSYHLLQRQYLLFRHLGTLYLFLHKQALNRSFVCHIYYIYCISIKFDTNCFYRESTGGSCLWDERRTAAQGM